MLRTATAGLFALVLFSPAAYAAVDCSASAIASAPLPLPATVVAPAAAEFYARSVQLGMPSGVLSAGYDQELTADRVLQRLRIEGCQGAAAAIPGGGAVNPNDPAAYKPQTAFDNTPWRFDMSQNGKRMTAEEFDAWMKARGVRVVKARPAAQPAVEAQAAEAAQTQ